MGGAAGHWVRGAGEVEEMGVLGVVELERAGERFEHAVRDAADVPALQALVVVNADAGQRGDLLAAKTRDTPLAVSGQTRLLRGDLRSPSGQELSDVVCGVHGYTAYDRSGIARRPWQYPSHRASQGSRIGASVRRAMEHSSAETTRWTSEELNRIDAAEELRIASLRRDGILRNPVTIWFVRCGDDLYVRSVNGPTAAWFRGTRVRHEGRIWAGGVEKDVVFVDADHEIDDQIDPQYRTKYGHYAAHIIDAITSPQARSTTLKLVPRA